MTTGPCHRLRLSWLRRDRVVDKAKCKTPVNNIHASVDPPLWLAPLGPVSRKFPGRASEKLQNTVKSAQQSRRGSTLKCSFDSPSPSTHLAKAGRTSKRNMIYGTPNSTAANPKSRNPRQCNDPLHATDFLYKAGQNRQSGPTRHRLSGTAEIDSHYRRLHASSNTSNSSLLAWSPSCSLFYPTPLHPGSRSNPVDAWKDTHQLPRPVRHPQPALNLIQGRHRLSSFLSRP